MHLFSRDGRTTTLPADAQPIDARFDEDSLWTSQRHRIQHIPLRPRSAITTVDDDPRPPMAGSDGSVHPATGEIACAYSVVANGCKFSGSHRLPDSPFATSYRSELEGQLGALAIMDEVCPTAIVSTCDNKAAIRNIVDGFWNPSQMLSPEADIVLACRHKIRSMANKPISRWIKGHQDSNVPVTDLPHDVQLNIELDNDAKRSRCHDVARQPTPYIGSGAMLLIDSKWVTTKYELQIQEASIRPIHIAWFLKKYPHLTPHDYSSIAWRRAGLARKRFSSTENIRIAKYINGWLNSGRQKGLFGQASECPGCGHHEETQLHMFQCNHPLIHQRRGEAFLTLEAYLRTHRIPFYVREAFLQLCWAICERRDPPLIYGHPTLQTAMHAQAKLGPDFILRGLLVREWLPALMHYTSDKPDVKLTHLYVGLWKILFPAVWEYRNHVLHGDDDVVQSYEREMLIHELTEWHTHGLHRLGYRQHYLAEFSLDTIHQWTNTTMRATLELLSKASKNYHESITHNRQRTMHDFFQPVNTDPDSDSVSTL